MNNDTGIDGADDPNKKQAPRQILSIPPRDSISSLQVGTLLNALGLTGSMLRQLSEIDYDDDSGKPARQSMSGECKLALETTLINTCSRLDSLMNDTARWDIKVQDTLEGAQRKIIAEQIKFSRAQTALSESIKAPHYERRPHLAQAGRNGLWLAIEGNPENLLDCIVGVGRSPEEANEAFDYFFKTGSHTETTARFMQTYAEERDALSAAKQRIEPTRPFEDADDTTPLPPPTPKNPNRPKRK